MRLALNAELRRLEVRLPFLATLGSAAPFIGLFGTVWGIMRSFEGIAAVHNTSLAVVAQESPRPFLPRLWASPGRSPTQNPRSFSA